MDRIYEFLPGVQAVAAAGIGVFVVDVDDGVSHLVRGALFEALCPQIDGRRSVAQIVERLAGRCSAAEVLYGIDWLAGRGHIVPADAAAAPGPRVEMLALGGEDAHALAAAMRAAGIDVALGVASDIEAADAADVGAGDDGAPLRVVVVDDEFAPALDALGLRMHARSRRWLPMRLGVRASWLGPLIGPGGPCWACLATRLRANRPVRRFLERRGEWPAPRRAERVPPAALALTAALAARVLQRRAAGHDDDDGTPPASTLWTIDHRRPALTPHPVSRRAHCPCCGSPDTRRRDGPLGLRRGVAAVADGGQRTVSALQTWQRLRRHVDPVTGIVASVGPLPGRPPQRQVWAASFLVCPVGDAPAFDDFHRSTLGKGRTPEQARASALCEAFERWSAVAQGDEPLRRAAWRELGAAALRPAELLGFSAAQTAARDDWNLALGDPRRHVPEPCDDDRVIAWTPAWSLTHGERRWLPAAYCYSHLPRPDDAAVCPFNPNGHAAGNTLEEAVLQAFLELVERDAVALWWYSRARRPAVDLAAFADAGFDGLRAHYAGMGWSLWVLDITTDLDIPACAAVAASADGQGWCLGFGCHLDARIAVERALTELNQLFGLDPGRPLPWSGGALADDGFLRPDATAHGRLDRAATSPADLLDAVQRCVERARRAGLETIALDLSRADVELSVAKVVVPGLRHFWPRFGPGRLYDVPPALGWVPARLREDELNPAHLFL